MKRILATTLILALSLFLIVGCNGDTQPAAAPAAEPAAPAAAEPAAPAAEPAAPAAEPAGDSGLVFGMTYWVETDFFAAIYNSAKEQAEADGNSVIVVDAGRDATRQIQIIEDFIAQGVDGVFLNPMDWHAIEPALRMLNDAGIPIVNFDAPVYNLEMVDAFVATYNVQAGRICGEAMIADFPDGGNIAVLNFPANGACVDRENGFLEAIEGHGFNVVATFDAEGSLGPGAEITADLLEAHTDLVAIFAINDQSGMGAYASVVGAGRDVAIYGVDGAPEALEVIAQETVYRMTAAQSPVRIGAESYRIMMILMAGGTPDQFQIDVPAFTIDRSNVDQFLGKGWN